MATNETLSTGLHGVPDYSLAEFKIKEHKVALVIPVIDEGYRIVRQLEKINHSNLQVDVIVADGGSTDGSLDYFRKPDSGLTALLIKRGGGKLSAQLRMAFHYCIKKQYESVITMDGNDKDGVEGVIEIQKALLSGYDFIQGSRFIKGGYSENTPLIRFLAIRLVHAPLTSIGAMHWYTDTTNGFRGFSAEFLKNQEVSIFRDVFSTYELISYLPISAARLKLKVTEVPVSRVYPKHVLTPTKIKGIGSHFSLLKILFNSMSGRYSTTSGQKGKMR